MVGNRILFVISTLLIYAVFYAKADVSEIVQPSLLPGQQHQGVQPPNYKPPEVIAQADQALDEPVFSPIEVTDACLSCLCYAISDCDMSKKCGGDICGPFGLTWAFWADAGKPTVPGETTDSKYAYADCANDYGCAAIAVRNYMQKYGSDCNGDGLLNCYDVGYIHQLGAYSCNGNLKIPFKNKFNQCAGA